MSYVRSCLLLFICLDFHWDLVCVLRVISLCCHCFQVFRTAFRHLLSLEVSLTTIDSSILKGFRISDSFRLNCKGQESMLIGAAHSTVVTIYSQLSSTDQVAEGCPDAASSTTTKGLWCQSLSSLLLFNAVVCKNAEHPVYEQLWMEIRQLGSTCLWHLTTDASSSYLSIVWLLIFFYS